jgi:hypothetical protein
MFSCLFYLNSLNSVTESYLKPNDNSYIIDNKFNVDIPLRNRNEIKR